MMNRINNLFNVFFFLITLLISDFVIAQESDYNPEKTYSKNQLLKDFEILTTALKEGHPGIYTFLSPDSLSFYIENTKSKLKDGLTEAEFHIIIRNFLVPLKCGHTVAMPSKGYYDYYRSKASLLPFDIYLIGHRVFIRLNNSSNLPVGTELTSINNVLIEEIVQKMELIQSRDGNSLTFVNHSIQENFKTYYLFLYGMSSSYTLTYFNNDKKEIKTTVAGELKKSIPTAILYDTVKYKEIVSIYDEKLFLSKENSALALLKIQGFQQKKYKKFYKNVFQSLDEKNIDNLVIDLRDNGGGYFPNAVELLSYVMKDKYDIYFSHPKIKYTIKKYTHWDFFSKLTKKMFALKPDKVKKKGWRTYEFVYSPTKKYHFDGTIYLLTNGGTFSMSGHVSAYLKDKAKAIMIGEETGGGEAGSNAILVPMVTLPETKIRVVIPYYKLEHNVIKDNLGRGVMPNYPTVYTIDQIINKEDLELKKVLELVEKTKIQ